MLTNSNSDEIPENIFRRCNLPFILEKCISTSLQEKRNEDIVDIKPPSMKQCPRFRWDQRRSHRTGKQGERKCLLSQSYCPVFNFYCDDVNSKSLYGHSLRISKLLSKDQTKETFAIPRGK